MVLEFLKERGASFKHALNGLKDILVTEHNAVIHAVMTLIVLVMASWLQIGTIKFVFIIIVITLVWITEALNTVLEIVIDIVSPEFTEAAKRAKDIAAAAVLFASMGALATGLVVLGPPLLIKLGW